jgi:membrane dipeptidase
MNMRKKYLVKWIVFSAVLLLLISCGSNQNEEALLARARDIHFRVLTVDSHCDTPHQLIREDWNIGERHNLDEGGIWSWIDFPRMKEGGLDAEFFAVYVEQGERNPEGYAQAREKADRLLDAIHRMGEDYQDLVEIATTPDDAYRLEKEGKIAAFIGMENGYPIGLDLSLIEYFYNRGVRYITLSHFWDNDICASSMRENPEDNGLSEFGKKVVAECNRLGMMVDVSHVSDKSFFDVLQVTKAPVIASHSSVRSICNNPRNLSDEMLKALAENGGVIQICLVSIFLKEEKPNPERDQAMAELTKKYGSFRDIKDEETRQKVRQEATDIYERYPTEMATLKDLVDHIDYVVKLIGIDHVGIGSDFDGGGGIEGCDDVSNVPHITEELVRRGYSEEDIGKIWGGNLMRVFRQVQTIAKQ